MGSAPNRYAVIAAVEHLAVQQGGVVSRRQARVLGAGKGRIVTEVGCGRWTPRGRHTIAVHRGPIPETGVWSTALFEVGSHAALDGSTALVAAGLTGYQDQVHVSCRHGGRPSRCDGVLVHELRHWSERDVLPGTPRRVRPEVAAVRAASWAATGRQAALLLILTVQQGLASPTAMLAETQRYPRLRRAELIGSILHEAGSGIHALGELDFAKLCRDRGLPEPTRQHVRTGPQGRMYLDAFWDDLGIVVEIEGIHHLGPLTSIDDALRQNEVTLDSVRVLRIPNLGLQLRPDDFMDQVEQLIRGRQLALSA